MHAVPVSTLSGARVQHVGSVCGKATSMTQAQILLCAQAAANMLTSCDGLS